MVVGSGWPPPDTFIERRLAVLVAAGIEVVVLKESDGTDLQRFITENIRVVPIHSVYSLRAWLWSAMILLRWILTRPGKLRHLSKIVITHTLSVKSRLVLARNVILLDQINPDVIHFEWNSAAIAHAWMFDWYSCKTVISCRGRQVNIWPYMPNKKEFTEALRYTFQKTSAAHCVSKALANEAVRHGLDQSKAHVIYTAVDPDFFHPADKKQNQYAPTKLIMVGALIWRKGFEYALIALRILHQHGHDVVLEIIGDGPEKDRIIFTAKDLGILDKIHLLGKLPPLQVRDHLQQADIFILASLSEGIANVAIEAMACGLPVVSTNCGGMDEAIVHGKNGFLVDTRDPEGLAEVISYLIKAPDKRIFIGTQARETILNRFTYETQAQQFAAFYRRLLQN